MNVLKLQNYIDELGTVTMKGNKRYFLGEEPNITNVLKFAKSIDKIGCTTAIANQALDYIQYCDVKNVEVIEPWDLLEVKVEPVDEADYDLDTVMFVQQYNDWKTIMWYLGYCAFTQGNPLKTGLLIKSKPNCGKTTLYEQVFKPCLNTSLAAFDGWGSKNIETKQLIFVDEVDTYGIIDCVQALKRVISPAEKIYQNLKCHPDGMFYNNAKWLFAFNNWWSITSDEFEAIKARFSIITLDKQFPMSNGVQNKLDINTLISMAHQIYFSDYKPNFEQHWNEWKFAISNVYKYLKQEQANHVSYQNYKYWCNDNGYKPMNEENYSKEVLYYGKTF